MTWRKAIEEKAILLKAGGVEEAKLQSELLAAFVLGVWNRGEVRAMNDLIVPESSLTKFNVVVARRLTGEPLQHIVGETEFFGLRMKTSPQALIPRPETEILVEQALVELSQLGLATPRVLDIGTGSGAIALAIANSVPSASMVAIDVSQDALQLAEENRERLGLKNVEFFSLDILSESIPIRFSQFDLVVSNPPYISLTELESVESEVKDFEPHVALTDFADGLSFYRKIAELASKLLKPSGILIMELGYTSSTAVTEILQNAKFEQIRLEKDLSGILRVIVAKTVAKD